MCRMSSGVEKPTGAGTGVGVGKSASDCSFSLGNSDGYPSAGGIGWDCGGWAGTGTDCGGKGIG